MTLAPGQRADVHAARETVIPAESAWSLTKAMTATRFARKFKRAAVSLAFPRGEDAKLRALITKGTTKRGIGWKTSFNASNDFAVGALATINWP